MPRQTSMILQRDFFNLRNVRLPLGSDAHWFFNDHLNVFVWTWDFWGGRTGNTSEKQKKKKDYFHCFSEEFFSKNDFEALFATFCCYDYGANASEAVEKSATDQKDYGKCSFCVL